MLGGKKEDLATLARFLDQEAERWEKIRLARDALSRIQSLVQAEADARAALEAAQADLAWARTQATDLEELLPLAKDAARRELDALRRKVDLAVQGEHTRHAEEKRRLDAQLADKRVLLEKLT